MRPSSMVNVTCADSGIACDALDSSPSSSLDPCTSPLAFDELALCVSPPSFHTYLTGCTPTNIFFSSMWWTSLSRIFRALCDAMRRAQPIIVAMTIGAPISCREFIEFASETSNAFAPRLISGVVCFVARSITVDMSAEMLYARPCFFVA